MKGQVLRVEHSKYGTLFAAMINGTGEIIVDADEEGNPLPFLTTDEILNQIMKFGFYVEYDEKSNLPSATINLLQSMYELGYDKITRVQVNRRHDGGISWDPRIIVMKSESNVDLLSFGCKVTRKVFDSKLEANTIRDLTDEEVNWSWLTYMANISDILDENIDPKDEYETDTGVHGQSYEEAHFTPYNGDTVPSVIDYTSQQTVDPSGFTPYVDPEDVDNESEETSDGVD